MVLDLSHARRSRRDPLGAAALGEDPNAAVQRHGAVIDREPDRLGVLGEPLERLDHALLDVDHRRLRPDRAPVRHATDALDVAHDPLELFTLTWPVGLTAQSQVTVPNVGVGRLGMSVFRLRCRAISVAISVSSRSTDEGSPHHHRLIRRLPFGFATAKVVAGEPCDVLVAR